MYRIWQFINLLCIIHRFWERFLEKNSICSFRTLKSFYEETLFTCLKAVSDYWSKIDKHINAEYSYQTRAPRNQNVSDTLCVSIR